MFLSRTAEEGGKGTGPLVEEPCHAAVPHGNVRRDSANSNSLVNQVLSDGRYALLLRPKIHETLAPEHHDRANQALQAAMAYVPAGLVRVEAWSANLVSHSRHEAPPEETHVEPFYIDRDVITNRQYQQFVDFGGYQKSSLWHPNIWPRVAEFVDSSGTPAPRFWTEGRPRQGMDDHPVVGISWFEADAYARWTGKRLPCDSEWVKAASWPVSTEGCKPIQRRYPWGESQDNERVNLWSSGRGTTAAVGEYPDGDAVGGIHQMIGNVWEWTSSQFQPWVDGVQVELERTLMSIRGASFDTYFDSHADCQTQSADCPLARKHNVGLRCAISACDLVVNDSRKSEPECDSLESLAEVGP